MTTALDLATRAADLAASWINGNRSHVLDALTSAEQAPAVIAALAVETVEAVADSDRPGMASRLVDAIINRATD